VKTFLAGRVRRFASSSACLVAVLVVGGAVEAQAQGNFGTIKGRLVWGGSEIPPRKNLVDVGASTKDPSVCAKDAPIPWREVLVDPATKGVRNGFAYLVRPQGSNPDAVQALVSKTPRVEIDQKNCEFLPYVSALHQDQALLLKSSDPVNHNVRLSAFTNPGFNQILPPNGQVELKLVAERQTIGMACDIHPWMKGYIRVFDHPFFTITKEDGSFEITGVPAGTQNLVLLLPDIGYANAGLARGMPVEVQAGQVKDVGQIKVMPKP